MGDAAEDLEPLFYYKRVQPVNVVCLDDDDSDASAAPLPKRMKTSETFVDEDVKVVIVEDEDWLPPPPKVTSNEDNWLGEDSTIKALRLKKQELLSFTKSAEDVLREDEESAEKKVEKSIDSSLESVAAEAAKPQNERSKIVISIQDKDGQKQYRVYSDDKFERLFKTYADRAKLDPKNLVFCFDGDKINSSKTPASLGMEDEDIIEVHMKKS